MHPLVNMHRIGVALVGDKGEIEGQGHYRQQYEKVKFIGSADALIIHWALSSLDASIILLVL
ncbi:hypothetical protein ES703_68964 [subsurface metagenome]